MNERYHFIGIGGMGMSALVRILLERNACISGSDIKPSAYLEKLEKKGVKIVYGHCASHLPEQMTTVVYSSIIEENNPELERARQRKDKVLHRSFLLAELAKEQKVFAVAGTHGKTTVSAMLSFCMLVAGKDPSFAIGGMLNLEEPLNGRQGKGEEFILEADESDGSFLNYHPFGAIITSIDAEHLDHYLSKERMEQAYLAFANKVQSESHFFYYGDDPLVPKIIKKGFSYGFKKENALHIYANEQNGWTQRFSFTFLGKKYADICVNAIGKHNGLNAAAVFGMLLQMGLEERKIREGLQYFPNVHRRCQIKGKMQSITFIDDYAHHPTEIQTTLRAIHEAVYPRRLVVIFEPHRFTRVRDLLDDFAISFALCDKLYITDIYAAGEQPIPGIVASTLIEAIQKRSRVHCTYLPREDREEILYNDSYVGDVIVTLGAGGITSLHDSLIPYFQKLPLKKIKVGMIFGGSSYEHEISLLSAASIAAALDNKLFDPTFISIDKKGRWRKEKGVEISLTTESGPLISQQILQQLDQCDLLFPILHGTMGEDGTIQGFFEMLKKPYVGCGWLSSALCMDKVLAKKLAMLESVSVLPFLPIHFFDWELKKEEIISTIENSFSLPLFVKPLHLGSSIAVEKVEVWEDLIPTILRTFFYDDEIMIEKGLIAPRELEFAILGDSQVHFAVPLPGELKTEGVVYDYEKKYGPNAIGVDLFPSLTKTQQEEGIEFAKKVYKALKCTGMARVDFFLDQEGKFWFNEINPIPGFTVISMYPKVWQREGVTMQDLVTKLLSYGLKRA